MGTRSLTVFSESDSKYKQEIAVLYGQWDGGPGEHGFDLAKFLRDIQPVVGITDRAAKIANGMPCLAAQVIAHLKTGPGDFYLYPAGARGMAAEFVYILTIEDLTIRVTAQDGHERTLFEGDAAAFYDWTAAQADPPERTGEDVT